MKVVVNIARVLVGALFIFSGLVKAIDPLGLAYKMQEFFEAWAADGYMKGMMDMLHDHALAFALVMIAAEILLGIALLIGWQRKLTTWLLLLLMLLFTFLTTYVLFSGKIRACGCFGDCIPLTPKQTFTKDVILLLLVILLLWKNRYIRPLFSLAANVTILMVSLVAISGLQWYVLRHLPVVDCLPYKKGNNLLELRKTPKDATYDKFYYTYFYKKGNEEKEFGMDKIPDSTWTFSRAGEKKLLEKGNGKESTIKDFSLTTMNGSDTTEALLGQKGKYYLLFVKELPGDDHGAWTANFVSLVKAKQAAHIPCYIVTAVPELADSLFNGYSELGIPIFTCDATAIKTAARCTPTLFFMDGPVVQDKWSWADLDKAAK